MAAILSVPWWGTDALNFGSLFSNSKLEVFYDLRIKIGFKSNMPALQKPPSVIQLLIEGSICSCFALL